MTLSSALRHLIPPAETRSALSTDDLARLRLFMADYILEHNYGVTDRQERRRLSFLRWLRERGRIGETV